MTQPHLRLHQGIINYALKVAHYVLRVGQKSCQQCAVKMKIKTLPAVDVGAQLALAELSPTQHFTKPPARF